MPELFTDRERAFEEKWAHDAETGFKIVARQTGLLGVWAAHQMGLSGPAAQAYAESLVKLAVGARKDGRDDVAMKLRLDFAACNTSFPDELLYRMRREFLEVAQKEFGVAPQP
jgi:hypothetical protein